jgi:hypothetical protein
MGAHASFLAYEEKPELFISKSKVAYEIRDGFCPMLTVTSPREAAIFCATLAYYGIASEFIRIAIRRI